MVVTAPQPVQIAAAQRGRGPPSVPTRVRPGEQGVLPGRAPGRAPQPLDANGPGDRVVAGADSSGMGQDYAVGARPMSTTVSRASITSTTALQPRL